MQELRRHIYALVREGVKEEEAHRLIQFDRRQIERGMRNRGCFCVQRNELYERLLQCLYIDCMNIYVCARMYACEQTQHAHEENYFFVHARDVFLLSLCRLLPAVDYLSGSLARQLELQFVEI